MVRAQRRDPCGFDAAIMCVVSLSMSRRTCAVLSTPAVLFNLLTVASNKLFNSAVNMVPTKWGPPLPRRGARFLFLDARIAMEEEEEEEEEEEKEEEEEEEDDLVC